MHAINCRRNVLISYLFGIWPRRRGCGGRIDEATHDYKEITADMRAPPFCKERAIPIDGVIRTWPQVWVSVMRRTSEGNIHQRKPSL